jgi:4-amino-4-deoxychorismate lyase
MATRRELVVALDGRVLEPDAPLVRADDPVFSRGDGVFETLLLRDRRPALLEAHLARLSDSAVLTGLPAPDVAPWRRAVAAAVAHWDADADEEAMMRLVYGRGRNAHPVAFVAVAAVPERVALARRDGVSVVTLDRGGSAGPAPWSSAGAKSSSYAANAAALVHAERLGAGDVVFCSSEGFVLEGPRSTVVIASDGALVTPPTSLPILPGTTVRALFDVATRRGLSCQQAILTMADLIAAQGIWLLSSVTLAARVHTLDGVPLRAAPGAPEVAALVDAAVEGEN